MNDIELTQLFVDYANLQDELADLKEKITAEILKREESVKIAGVTATYYKPTLGTPDYEGAVTLFLEQNPAEEYRLKEFQSATITTKWKEACVAFRIAPNPSTEEKPARVVIK